ncbi:MAG: hypothetical protein H6Q89_3675, partial [Myxococcaceae bacterium]|nr:hypothetical protein [Myxococcaceae bacterium]
MYPNRRGLERRWALALLLLAPTAWAHDADVVYVMLADAPGGQLEEHLTLTASTLSLLAPIDADRDGSLSQADLDARAGAISAGVWEQLPLAGGVGGAGRPCVRSAERALLREGYVELSARFDCPEGPLSQDFRILRVLTTNYRVVLGRQGDGETGRAFAQGNVQRLVVRAEPVAPAPAQPGFAAGALSPLIWFDVTLVWLLALLLAGSLTQVGQQWLVLTAGQAATALAVGELGLRLPEWIGAALVAGVGGAFAIQVLARGRARWPL